MCEDDRSEQEREEDLILQRDDLSEEEKEEHLLAMRVDDAIARWDDLAASEQEALQSLPGFASYFASHERRKRRRLAGKQRAQGAAWEAYRVQKRGREGTADGKQGMEGAPASASIPCLPSGQRFDRILLHARRAVPQRGKSALFTLEFVEDTFSLLQSPESDHRGVRCHLSLSDARERQRQRRAQCLGAPLRAGARGRVGDVGVARRPTKNETCARVEPHSEKKPGGPVYYCSKHYEPTTTPLRASERPLHIL